MFALTLFQYLEDIGCPFPTADRNAVIDWMLGCAVQLEYGDNGNIHFVFFIASVSDLLTIYKMYIYLLSLIVIWSWIYIVFPAKSKLQLIFLRRAF